MIFFCLPNRSCYVIICLFPLWCCFGFLWAFDFFISWMKGSRWASERRWRSQVVHCMSRSRLDLVCFFSHFGGKTIFVTKGIARLWPVLVCEGSQQECFVCQECFRCSLYWRRLSLLPLPEKKASAVRLSVCA